MSLETEHRRHHTEPTPYPDEPQPIKWPRHAADWTFARTALDAMYGVDPNQIGNGKRRAE